MNYDFIEKHKILLKENEKKIIKYLKKHNINPNRQLVSRIQRLKELTGNNFNIRTLKSMIPNTPEEKMLIKQIKTDVRKMRSISLEL